ncbi:hypothetical protein ACIP5Y_18325 [Nocardia sp. NPDC088792]|uniref:hypothetical protein n=1 Tax=Nocardia sp. NPDC088792 TaxID=3364332 RepID=UPI0037F2EE49
MSLQDASASAPAQFERIHPMLSTPIIGQFRKAAASSPQQACVMVYRDDHRTLLWDDKLAAGRSAGTAVPLGQCLSFEHDQFEAIQESLRAGAPVGEFLVITEKSDGCYEFSAAPARRESAGSARLLFDRAEYRAFVEAVGNYEFER